MTPYQGNVYRASDQLWAWDITKANIGIDGASGYETEDDAVDAMDVKLLAYENAERGRHVHKLLVSFDLAGLKPTVESELFYQAYIDGNATLDALYNHIISFALHNGGDDGRTACEQLAAGS